MLLQLVSNRISPSIFIALDSRNSEKNAIPTSVSAHCVIIPFDYLTLN
jgi:hypothetical protein